MNLPKLFLICKAAFAGVVLANTSIRHFTPAEIAASHPLAIDNIAIARTLLAPTDNTLDPIESLYSLQSTNTTEPDRHRWYKLTGLKNDASYELRVSYAATTPADFHIAIYRLGQLSNSIDLAAHITADYEGVSVYPEMQNRPIPFVLTLEERVLGLVPLQAIKLATVLIPVLLFAFFVATPWLTRKIQRETLKQKPQ